MATSITQVAEPLTLSEQLDAMLTGWLERQARVRGAVDPAVVARAVVCVAERVVGELAALCARWDLTVERTANVDGRWAVLVVEGRILPVEGLIELTSMYRR